MPIAKDFIRMRKNGNRLDAGWDYFNPHNGSWMDGREAMKYLIKVTKYYNDA